VAFAGNLKSRSRKVTGSRQDLVVESSPQATNESRSCDRGKETGRYLPARPFRWPASITGAMAIGL
jgi:hypothetical protein